MLFLGSGSQLLPAEVLGRPSVWVRLSRQGREIPGSPFQVNPQGGAFRLAGSVEELLQLAERAPGTVDAAYLAAMANFLAGNLGYLDLEAISYSVVGVGPVIDGAGQWVGDPPGLVGPTGPAARRASPESRVKPVPRVPPARQGCQDCRVRLVPLVPPANKDSREKPAPRVRLARPAPMVKWAPRVRLAPPGRKGNRVRPACCQTGRLRGTRLTGTAVRG